MLVDLGERNVCLLNIKTLFNHSGHYNLAHKYTISIQRIPFSNIGSA